MQFTDDYPDNFTRDQIANLQGYNAAKRQEECKNAAFNIGPGGVRELDGVLQEAMLRYETGEPAFVYTARGDGSSPRLQISEEPICQIDDGAFAPDRKPRMSSLQALVIVGDRLYAVGITRDSSTGDVMVSLRNTGYGETNVDYSDRPGSESLGRKTVTASGELDGSSPTIIRGDGIYVEYGAAGLSVGADGQEPGATVTVLTNGTLKEASDSDRPLVRDAAEQLIGRMQDNAPAWRP